MRLLAVHLNSYSVSPEYIYTKYDWLVMVTTIVYASHIIQSVVKLYIISLVCQSYLILLHSFSVLCSGVRFALVYFSIMLAALRLWGSC